MHLTITMTLTMQSPISYDDWLKIKLMKLEKDMVTRNLGIAIEKCCICNTAQLQFFHLER